MHLSMLSPTIPHPGYTRAKWGFDNIKYEIPTPLGTPCCQMPLLPLLMLWDLTILNFCACQNSTPGAIGWRQISLHCPTISQVGYSGA